MDSAYAITRRHDRESFVRTFGEAMGEETARQTYAKAVQVHGAVLNIATSYLTARIAPPLARFPSAPTNNPESWMAHRLRRATEAPA